MVVQLLSEIRSNISRHVAGGKFCAPMPGVRLVAATAPVAQFRAIYEPGLALIAQGAKRTVLGDKVFNYEAGQYLVVSVDLPILAEVIRASREEPYLVFCLTLKPASIAALLLETSAGNAADAGTAGAGLAVCDAPAELLDPIARLIRLVDHPEDIAVLAPMLEREILYRLLTGPQGNQVRQIGIANSRLSQLSRAISWIRSHYADNLRIDELAQIAGMSPASFHRHFRTLTAMSPLQYQKQIRLQEARARLISDAKNVAAVGFAVGYDSPSQFSREYSRFFGVPPGQDIKRLRAESETLRGLA